MCSTFLSLLLLEHFCSWVTILIFQSFVMMWNHCDWNTTLNTLIEGLTFLVKLLRHRLCVHFAISASCILRTALNTMYLWFLVWKTTYPAFLDPTVPLWLRAKWWKPKRATKFSTVRPWQWSFIQTDITASLPHSEIQRKSTGHVK